MSINNEHYYTKSVILKDEIETDKESRQAKH